jgi:hypothetical protein
VDGQSRFGDITRRGFLRRVGDIVLFGSVPVLFTACIGQEDGGRSPVPTATPGNGISTGTLPQEAPGRGGRTTVLTGTTDRGYVDPTPTLGQRYDATKWTSTASGYTSPICAEVGSDASPAVEIEWLGGLFLGRAPTAWTWDQAHSYGGAGIRSYLSGPMTYSYLRVHNIEDGLQPREVAANMGSWILHDSYFSAMRDDCIEDDDFMPGTVQDCLMDGVRAFISEQNESRSSFSSIGPDESPFINVARCYVRIHTANAGNDGPGHFFKWQGRGVQNHTPVITDSVFALEQKPAQCWESASFPPDTVFIGTNYVCWLGPGSYPGQAPAAVTVLTGDQAQSKWTRARNAWLTAHGMTSSSQPATVDPFSIDHDARVPVPSAYIA